jgi:hypothetical protein
MPQLDLAVFSFLSQTLLFALIGFGFAGWCLRLCLAYVYWFFYFYLSRQIFFSVWLRVCLDTFFLFLIVLNWSGLVRHVCDIRYFLFVAVSV